MNIKADRFFLYLFLLVLFFFSGCGISHLNTLPALNVPSSQNPGGNAVSYLYFSIPPDYMSKNVNFSGIDIYYKLFPSSDSYYSSTSSFQDQVLADQNTILNTTSNNNLVFSGSNGPEGLLLAQHYYPVYVDIRNIANTQKPYIPIEKSKLNLSQNLLIRLDFSEPLNPNGRGEGPGGNSYEARIQFLANTSDPSALEQAITNTSYFYNVTDQMYFQIKRYDGAYPSFFNLINHFQQKNNIKASDISYFKQSYGKDFVPGQSDSGMDVVFYVVAYGQAYGQSYYSIPQYIGYLYLPKIQG